MDSPLSFAGTPSLVNETNSPVSSGSQNGTALATGTSNEHLPGASGPAVLGATWSLTLFAALFLAARLYVKRRHGQAFWWDDHLLAASWVMLALFAATASHCVSVGLGDHAGSSAVQQTPLQLSVLIAAVFSALGAAWSKTSFALTLLRITREGSRALYWGIWCVVLTMNVVLGLNAIVQFVWCAPAEATWNADLEGAWCWDRNVVVRYAQFAASYSAAMDFVLAALPIMVMAKISMRLREKFGVMVCMSLCVIAGVTSIMRAIMISALTGSDFPYKAGQLFIWTGAELTCTIVAASVFILRVPVSEMKHSRYPDFAELNTFKPMGQGGGIHVTKETIISRSPSTRVANRGYMDREDEDGLLTPMAPAATYHSYIKA
ncbi:unnamed protein product [Discula destructiva]